MKLSYAITLVCTLLLSLPLNAQDSPTQPLQQPPKLLSQNYQLALTINWNIGEGDNYEFLVASSQFDTQFDQSRIKFQGYVEEVKDGRLFLQYKLSLEDNEIVTNKNDTDSSEKKVHNSSQKLSVFLKPGKPLLILDDGKRSFTLTVTALD